MMLLPNASTVAARARPPGQGHRIRGLIALAVSALLAAACAGAHGPVAAQAESGSSRDPVQVSLLTSAAGSGIVNINTNWFTQFAARRFGLKFNWTNVAENDLATKQSLELASGDYPDAFWTSSLTPSELEQYHDQGVIVSLNSLVKTYAPNVWNAIQTSAAVRDAAESPSGQILDIPAYNYCFHCYYSSKIWIDTSVLQRYGLSMPTTTSAFQHVLSVLVHHGYLPLLGDTDGWRGDVITQLMNAFVYDPGEANSSGYLDIGPSGSLTFAPEAPGWLNGLRYLHSLYAQGLLGEQSFTQTQVQLEQQAASGKLAVFAGGGPNGIVSNYQDYAALPPLKGPTGLRYAAFYGNGSQATISFSLTNRATRQQAIRLLKLINYIWTPAGTETMDFGPQGKYWRKGRSTDLGLVPGKAIFSTDWNEFYSGTGLQNAGWNQLGTMDQSYTWRQFNASDPPFSPNGSQALLQLYTEAFYAGFQPSEVVPANIWVAPSEAQQYREESTNINNYVNQSAAAFITGSKPLSDWNGYLAGLKNLGLSRYLSISKASMGKPFSTSGYGYSAADVHFLLGESEQGNWSYQKNMIGSVSHALHG